MNEAVIVSAVRTAIGKIGGTLKNVEPDVLLTTALQGAIDKCGIEKEVIDQVICGHVKQSTDQPNISRVSGLELRLPESTPAYTVHCQCASGMQAIVCGMMQIQCNQSDVILCGGVESQSTAPFYVRGARFGVGNGNTLFLDPNIEGQFRSQPNDIYGRFNMINTADNVGKMYSLTREECDEFAYGSQRKAIAAIDNGTFAEEIVPVIIPQRKGNPIVFDTDEFPKRDTSPEKLAKLRAINEGGVTTAGNASGRNDGAAGLVLMSADKAKELGCKPMAKIIGTATAGVDPRYMGLGPVASTRKMLARMKDTKLSLEDFGVIELNEAFAAQSLGCIKELGLNREIINVNGGAIALGHPLGCTGARITTTLVHEMARSGKEFGLATLCVGGGMGMSLALQLM